MKTAKRNPKSNLLQKVMVSRTACLQYTAKTMRTLLRTQLRPMTEADIAQVMDIEREAFPSAWPQTAYKRELRNSAARYLVITERLDQRDEAAQGRGVWSTIRRIVGSDTPSGANERLLGFIGIWLMVGEAHIVTVAVREEYRRSGIGERLLIAAVELAQQYDQELVTLEVRASNHAAQELYEKYGFDRAGLRVRYYSDNHEDAVIMTTPRIASPEFRGRFEALKARHRQRNPDLWA
jgi:ribosomal-protein-alanine N-acetyltransferase